MNPRLEDKIVLLTGIGAGDSGRIGRGVAAACAFEAADVWAVGPGSDALAPLEGLPGIAIRVADMADSKRRAGLADDIGAIDVLINLTEIADPATNISELDEEAFDQAWASMVKAPALAIQTFLPAMGKRGGGAIINIAPPAPEATNIAYETAVAALSGFCVAFAARHDTVRCNTIRPGALTPSSLDSIAQACLYQASESGALMTGQTLALTAR
jgi:NAD(P)-dependent dehydrogenase (short-subunit alcohol dehydrogenase family)